MDSPKIKLGIVGFPLSHTLSPIMHEAALKSLGLNGEYLIYEIPEDELSLKINGFKKTLTGLNVTIPYKTKVMEYVDELSDNAKLIGAVNTLIFRDGKIIGENTDIIGFWDSIDKDYKDHIQEIDSAVIGYGGSSLSVCVALIKNNIKSITIFGRDQNKLNIFLDNLNTKKKILNSNTNISVRSLQKINLSQISFLINTTPLGMSPNTDSSPVSRNDLSALSKNALVYDLIYNPSMTKLLKDSADLGFRIQNGLDMLVRQGAASLSLWLNKDEVPITIMKESLTH